VTHSNVTSIKRAPRAIAERLCEEAERETIRERKIDLLERARIAREDYPKALLALAELYDGNNAEEGPAKRYRILVVRNPDATQNERARACLGLAVWYARFDKPTMALNWAALAVEHDPTLWAAYIAAAVAAIKGRRVETAEWYLARLLEKAPETDDSVHMARVYLARAANLNAERGGGSDG